MEQRRDCKARDVPVWSRLELVRLARHGQEAEERDRSGYASFRS